MPRVARPAPSDRAPSPFENLIGDTSQPPEAAPPPQDSKVAKSDDKQAPAKSKDCKAVEPNDDTKPANTDEVTATDEVATDGSTAKVDGKKIAKPEAASDVGDSIQPESDHEPAAGQKTNDVNATETADGIVTVTSSDAISIVQTPAQTPNETPDDGKQVEQPLQQPALVAGAAPKINQLGADLPKVIVGKKSDDGKPKQVDADDQVKTDQPTAETDDAFQILTKDAAPQHPEGKPQTETGDGDKHMSRRVGAISVTASHRSDAGAPDSGWRRRQRCRENIERRSDADPNSQQRPSRIGKCRSAGYSCFAARPTARGYSAVRSRHRDYRQGTSRQEPF